MKTISNKQLTTKPYIQFKGHKSWLVELAVALWVSELLQSDGRALSLKQIRQLLEDSIDVDLKDLFVIDINNRARKKEATPFLQLLIEKYNSRSDQLLD